MEECTSNHGMGGLDDKENMTQNRPGPLCLIRMRFGRAYMVCPSEVRLWCEGTGPGMAGPGITR